jgi:hypothetical protein
MHCVPRVSAKEFCHAMLPMRLLVTWKLHRPARLCCACNVTLLVSTAFGTTAWAGYRYLFEVQIWPSAAHGAAAQQREDRCWSGGGLRAEASCRRLSCRGKP